MSSFGGSNDVLRIIGGPSGWLFSKHIAIVLLFGLMISRGMMQIIALAVEGRWLRGVDQYPSFWYGDLIAVPAFLVIIKIWATIIARSQPEMSYSSLWHILAIVIAIAVAINFRIGETNAYPTAVLYSPTKIYHDLIIFPVVIYTVVSALPILFMGHRSDWVGVVLIIAVFAWFLYLQQVLDQRPEVKNNAKPHIAFDWRTMRQATQKTD